MAPPASIMPETENLLYETFRRLVMYSAVSPPPCHRGRTTAANCLYKKNSKETGGVISLSTSRGRVWNRPDRKKKKKRNRESGVVIKAPFFSAMRLVIREDTPSMDTWVRNACARTTRRRCGMHLRVRVDGRSGLGVFGTGRRVHCTEHQRLARKQTLRSRLCRRRVGVRHVLTHIRTASSLCAYLYADPYADLYTGTYRKLVEMHREGKLSFKNVATFNIDEFAGISR